ncbi:cupin domain-containing protein [Pseudoroseomonas ludipueritiae]|uniref:Cupin domain-containing protein n=1 Tax=Pseudoroseomonas ludipueritiae TaxID=198093 RepID=A0ABR7R5I8_9PROT|nr:cupin domain-containing protein [Pseudoroseomonas ludipueritiae]MBC9177037.1 cupin domain-containing protein [Pseudoroseomonas ludipueritiae]MCG7362715.1 cupin domain-containing protein [Roseomonas sp. ACRSG]
MSTTLERRYFVRAEDVPGYSPANHTGTVNRRLIGPETVGAKTMEVLLGSIDPGQGALPHAHPGMEQACYILSGRARAEVGGQSREIGPGEMCFFPAGEEHIFTVVGDEPVKLLVIYSPPYGEDPAKVVRRAGEAHA